MKRRTLIDDKTVPERKEAKNINISTHCPSKWLFVDMETGQVWKYHHKGGYKFYGDAQMLCGEIVISKEDNK